MFSYTAHTKQNPAWNFQGRPMYPNPVLPRTTCTRDRPFEMLFHADQRHYPLPSRPFSLTGVTCYKRRLAQNSDGVSVGDSWVQGHPVAISDQHDLGSSASPLCPIPSPARQDSCGRVISSTRVLRSAGAPRFYCNNNNY